MSKQQYNLSIQTNYLQRKMFLDPAANRLYRLDTGKIYYWTTDKKLICPYMNLVKYFRKDWKPEEDNEWKEFVNK